MASGKAKKATTSDNYNNGKVFEEYWPKELIKKQLKKGKLLQGNIRINPKNYKQAFVPIKGQKDIFIDGFIARNRALEGDLVVIQTNPESEWKSIDLNSKSSLDEDESLLDLSDNFDNDAQLSEYLQNKLTVEDVINDTVTESDQSSSSSLQKTGKVVYIKEIKHSRISCGLLRMEKKPNGFALFIPRDHRLPRVRVPLTQCPKELQDLSEETHPDLFLVKIVNWTATNHFAAGKLLRRLGLEGEIESETKAILAEFEVDTSPFSNEILKDLPSDWHISKKQLKCRKDLRSSCIFTIDPATAKDLDDALSCEPLDNGNFEVGVHIADVSYFVQENTPVDKLAKKRTITFYLVQKAITMLPSALCENYCSLTAGEDRLTFSVIWELTPNGKIVNEWFGKSIINSCCKMNYDHAQDILDNPTKSWKLQDFPQIFGGHTISKIVSVIQNLNKIAQELLTGRRSSGAIELNQGKQWFALDSESGYPTSCKAYEMKASNGLVKEFMLLANISVAKKILTGFPKTAFLRRQPSPTDEMTQNMAHYCKNLLLPGRNNDYRDIQASLLAIEANDPSGCLSEAVSHVFLRAMKRAEYFCSGSFDSEDDYWHYCLNIPLYTHFTSPIRRYPDVIVHQGKTQEHSIINDTTKLDSLAKVCNERKLAQFNVGKKSAELFFALYVRNCGPLLEDAMVMGLLDSSIDVLLTKYGLVKRVYCDAHNLENWKLTKKSKRPKLTIYWNATETTKEFPQEICLFSKVKVIIQNDGKQTPGFMALLQHPNIAANNKRS